MKNNITEIVFSVGNYDLLGEQTVIAPDKRYRHQLVLRTAVAGNPLSQGIIITNYVSVALQLRFVGLGEISVLYSAATWVIEAIFGEKLSRIHTVRQATQSCGRKRLSPIILIANQQHNIVPYS